MQNQHISAFEQFRYRRESLTESDIEDLLIELDTFRQACDNHNYKAIEADTLEAYLDELESNQENPDHADYDDLKSFFDDCVDSLNKCWPCAEAYDTNLRQVICEAIAKGSIESEDA